MARTKILIDCDPGMTVCDLRPLTTEGRRARGGAEPNARVAIQSDARRLIDAVVDTMLSRS
jgi:inosine-uridine nucleoside N-ribohydrolase